MPLRLQEINIMKSQFSTDESFRLSDMIGLLLHGSFGRQVSNAFFFFYFYIAFIVSISHFFLSPFVLYLYCTESAYKLSCPK